MGNGIYDDVLMWEITPDTILIKIFGYLSAKELSLVVGCVNKRWSNIALDKHLWKWLLYRDFRLSSSQFHLSRFCEGSYHGEYVRMFNTAPSVLDIELTEHRDEVLHVAFAPDGSLFSTTSKDCMMKLWSSGVSLDSQCRKVYELDLKELFHWKYTQFSQFNDSSSLLLVSGVHLGRTNFDGEIVIYEILKEGDEYELVYRCRTANRPYDVFGCWYDDQHILNGELQRISQSGDNYLTLSCIWLCKASQDCESERTAVMAPLFKLFINLLPIEVGTTVVRKLRFLNKNGSNVRMIMASDEVTIGVKFAVYQSRLRQREEAYRRKEKLSQTNLTDAELAARFEKEYNDFFAGCSLSSKMCSLQCSNCHRRHSKSPPNGQFKSVFEKGIDIIDGLVPSPKLIKRSDNVSSFSFTDSNDDPVVSVCTCLCHSDVKDRLLIFSCGTDTFSPHMIGFKLIDGKEMLRRLKAELMPEDRLALIRDHIALQKQLKEAKQAAAAAGIDMVDSDNIIVDSDEDDDDDNYAMDVESRFELMQDGFDRPDHVIDLRGHITGMTLSRDKRFLYVNVRSWPEGCVISDPTVPPPISREIEVRVIDLHTLCLLDNVRYSSHLAFTPHEECFFIFLDAAEQFVASGSEDKAGFVWDKHHGCVVAQLPHDNVVNCVAFNPVDQEMIVSVSDDFRIKVWRSRRQMKIANILRGQQ